MQILSGQFKTHGTSKHNNGPLCKQVKKVLWEKKGGRFYSPTSCRGPHRGRAAPGALPSGLQVDFPDFWERGYRGDFGTRKTAASQRPEPLPATPVPAPVQATLRLPCSVCLLLHPHLREERQSPHSPSARQLGLPRLLLPGCTCPTNSVSHSASLGLSLCLPRVPRPSPHAPSTALTPLPRGAIAPSSKPGPYLSAPLPMAAHLKARSTQSARGSSLLPAILE